MVLLTTCECGQDLQATDDRAGEIVSCPSCQRTLKLPTEPTDTAWRRDNCIVLRKGFAPPQRCFRCNIESQCKPRRERLDWNPGSRRFELNTSISVSNPLSWFFWKNFGSIFGTMRVFFRLCPSCSRRRRRIRLACHLARLLGVLTVPVAIWHVEMLPDAALLAVCLAGCLAVVGAKYFVHTGDPMTDAWAIGDHVWFEGVSPQLLLRLPEWGDPTNDDAERRPNRGCEQE